MNKYDRYYNSQYEEARIEDMLIEDETVIWKGKPKRNAYFLNCIFTPFTIFALLWFTIDATIIVSSINATDMVAPLFFLIPFMAIHLMPFWMWLGNILTARIRWENTEYLVTDRRILLKTGIWGVDIKTVYYKEIRNVTLIKGIVDATLGVGDIYFELAMSPNTSSSSSGRLAMFDLENPYEIYTRLQKTVLDIQTDIEYPNALRPEENPGYKTKYKGQI